MFSDPLHLHSIGRYKTLLARGYKLLEGPKHPFLQSEISVHFFTSTTTTIYHHSTMLRARQCLQVAKPASTRWFSASSALGKKDQTPMQVFMDTFKKEWGKSKELQDNIKALNDETGRMAESETFKRAKAAYANAQKGSSATSKQLKKAAGAVGSAAGAAWNSPVGQATRKGINVTADTLDKAAEPIRKTKAYKDIKDVIDDGSSIRYGGFEDKGSRRSRRMAEQQARIEEELRTGVKTGPVMPNEEAGSDLVVHATARASNRRMPKFDENSVIGKTGKGVASWWEESDNGFIATLRAVTSKVGRLFDETEAGKVIRMFKLMDPSFNQDQFMKTTREYIIPEVLEAWVTGDGETLKMWLSEAPYNIWATQTKQYTEQGLFADGKILDIRGVDIMSAKVLPPSDVPVYVISCRAQEVHLYRKAKTGELAAGTEDNIQQSTYVMVLTRVPEDMGNPETGGWKILEMVRGASRSWT